MSAIALQESIELGTVVVLSLISIILLMLSAIASGSEVAFFSLTQRDMEELESRSDSASRRVIDLMSNPDRLLATILVANNMVNICLVIISTKIVDNIFTFTGIGDFLFKTIVITFMLLLFGEIMPKVFTQANAVRMSLFFSAPLKVLRWLVYPLAFILMRTSSRVSRMASKSAEISIEELADAVDLTDTGSEEEQKMLSGIISFGQTEVVEIMHSRVDITGIEFDTKFDEVRRTIVRTGYSRIPVYGEDLDDVRGMLYVKDLLPHIAESDDFEWQRLLRKPYFVPEHMMIDDLLKKFQKKKIHIAIVVDEYGATQGLISLEDILEEVVGEISDESDVDEPQCYDKIAEGVWIFDAKTHLGDMAKIVGVDESLFDKVKGNAETLAGVMLEYKRRFLRKGDTLRLDGITLTVTEAQARKVSRIKIETNDNVAGR